MDEQGSFSLTDLNWSWGNGEGVSEEDVLAAVRAHMFHERSGGALRFAMNTDANGNIRLRALPKRSWAVKQGSASAKHSPSKKPADHDDADQSHATPSTAIPRLPFVPKKSSVSSASSGVAETQWKEQSRNTAGAWQEPWVHRPVKPWVGGSKSDWRWRQEGWQDRHWGRWRSREVSSSSGSADDGEQSQSGCTQQLQPRHPSHSPPPRQRPSLPERPEQPPGEHWTKYQDDGNVWWYYDGPLGPWWKPDGSEEILPYNAGEEGSEEP